MTETVPEAMKRYRRDEIFAQVAKLPPAKAAEALATARTTLRRYDGRTIRRDALAELLRDAGVRSPVEIIEAMTRYGFLDPCGERGRLSVALEPPALCSVRPPVSPATAEKKLRAAIGALFANATPQGDA